MFCTTRPDEQDSHGPAHRAHVPGDEPAARRDAFHPDLPGQDSSSLPLSARLHHIRADALDGDTAQTGGMRRFAAISGGSVGSERIWMGQTHVAPDTASSNHHHGASGTAVHIIKGHPEFVFLDDSSGTPEEIRIRTAPGDYIFVPPYVPHREENPSPDVEAVVVIARRAPRGNFSYTRCMRSLGVVVASGREKAYVYLKDTVLTDPAMQGEFLSEQEIADRIGVSRTPIREALLLLAAEDLVELVPKRGARVAPLTGREITELMQLRGIVERYAAQHVIGTGQAPVRELGEFLERQRTLGGPDQAKEFIDVDHLFHSSLVAAVGNALLDRHYEGLRSRQVRAGVVALYNQQGRQEAVLDEHRAIVDALAAGDSQAACAAIDSHLESTLKVLLAG